MMPRRARARMQHLEVQPVPRHSTPVRSKRNARRIALLQQSRRVAPRSMPARRNAAARKTFRKPYMVPHALSAS